jgi:hypothetical protein
MTAIADQQVTITLTPDQASVVVDELCVLWGDAPGEVATPEELAFWRTLIDVFDRHMAALGWGRSDVPVTVSETAAWWVQLATALMTWMEHTADLGRRSATVDELLRAVNNTPKVLVAVEIVRQLRELHALPDAESPAHTYVTFHNLRTWEMS